MYKDIFVEDKLVGVRGMVVFCNDFWSQLLEMIDFVALT